ncbi:hypothetical protein N9A62_03965, partial [Akkermansiaceae bacterium]|nr:hypothetical protein [Akkermansiaceae bacterium]
GEVTGLGDQPAIVIEAAQSKDVSGKDLAFPASGARPAYGAVHLSVNPEKEVGYQQRKGHLG